MKALFWILVAGIAAVAAFRFLGGSGPAPTPIAFQNATTLADAMDQAESSGKPVLAFATADWCGPCQALKRGPLADEAVTQKIKDGFIPVYIDVDAAPADAQAIQVSSIPALIVIRDRQIASRLEGGADTDRVLAWLDRALK